ncbi:MAG: aldo/keto reductase, partial [Sphingomonadales bacterium]
MELRTLGATGMRVSPLCLGTMMFGAIGNTDHDDCVRIIHRAIDAGINFIDTADVYSHGESEEIVGKAIKGRRDGLIVATKFFNPMSQDPNHRGGSRRWIVQAVEDSLRRLGTDYIDLYQIHRYDADTDIEEVLFTLTELVRQGKIRQFGSSMFSADRIVESHWAAERMGTLRFRC